MRAGETAWHIGGLSCTLVGRPAPPPILAARGGGQGASVTAAVSGRPAETGRTFLVVGMPSARSRSRGREGAAEDQVVKEVPEVTKRVTLNIVPSCLWLAWQGGETPR